MELREIINKARAIKEKYAVLNRTEGFKPWGLSEYLQGFMGDVGDLSKLVMAKEGNRFVENDLEKDLKKELSDCLYGIITIADELGVDLESEFLSTLDELNSRISERKVILEDEAAEES